MERIKQALERARAERESAADAGVIASPRAPFGGSTQPRRMARHASAELKVTYTQTAKVTVDVERLRENRIVAMVENDPAANAYKVLRTHVLQRMRANSWKTLAITSPGQAAGKTVTAINLAISLASEVNQTVLLVDLDLRHPSIGGYFFDEPGPGISDYLIDDRPVAELLIHPGIDRLVILAGNRPFTHSSEMLSSPKMIRLVEELKGRYPDRLILFDMPPVLAGDDVIAFCPYLDAMILVVEAGKTTTDELSQAYALLDDEKVLGAVLNKAEEASTGGVYY